MALRAPASILALCASTALVACGTGEGVADGTTLTVYAEAPLCRGARQELRSAGRRAGSFRVRVLCLEPGHGRGGLDLAAIGANARRATEDTTTIGYIEAGGG